MYEFHEIRFDLNSEAPPGQQWADVRLVMAGPNETFHGVRAPVLVSNDPSMTLAEFREGAISEVRKLLEAALRVATEHSAADLLGKQDADRAAEAAEREEMNRPEYVQRMLSTEGS